MPYYSSLTKLANVNMIQLKPGLESLIIIMINFIYKELYNKLKDAVQ